MRETEERHGMGLFDFLGGRERNADRGSSSNDRPSSIEINGRTVTDPAQIDRIERNREASARNAVDSYQSEGTPIPAHLRDTVDRQIARGDYDQKSSTRGSLLDLFRGPAPGSTASILGTRSTSQRGNLLDLFLGPPPGSTASILGTPRPGPTPGPGYYAGLGTPGVARDDVALVATDPAATDLADVMILDPEPAAGTILPNLAALPVAPVQAGYPTQFTFQDYLAQLNRMPGGGGAIAPPPVQPIALTPPALQQGIMSLPPTGFMG
jgi:hypothetical protein